MQSNSGALQLSREHLCKSEMESSFYTTLRWIKQDNARSSSYGLRKSASSNQSGSEFEFEPGENLKISKSTTIVRNECVDFFDDQTRESDVSEKPRDSVSDIDYILLKERESNTDQTNEAFAIQSPTESSANEKNESIFHSGKEKRSLTISTDTNASSGSPGFSSAEDNGSFLNVFTTNSQTHRK